MATKVTILRSSLLSLVFAAAIPAAWSTDGAPTPSATATPATAYSAPAVQNSSKPPTPKMLDLKSPDIHTVMSADQIAAAIPNPDDSEVLEPDEIAVRGVTPAPYVPGGFAAIYWGVTHPLESWRIFAPVL